MSAYAGEYESELRPYVDAMRYKLIANKHKGKSWDTLNLDDLFKKLIEEVEELREAIACGNTIEILLEAADTGNLAMMISSIAIKRAAAGHGSDGKKPSVV